MTLSLYPRLTRWGMRQIRRLRLCRRKIHRWEARQTPCSGVTKQDGVPYAAGALVWTCVDCLRSELLGDVIPDATNRTARRGA